MKYLDFIFSLVIFNLRSLCNANLCGEVETLKSIKAIFVNASDIDNIDKRDLWHQVEIFDGSRVMRLSLDFPSEESIKSQNYTLTVRAIVSPRAQAWKMVKFRLQKSTYRSASICSDNHIYLEKADDDITRLLRTPRSNQLFEEPVETMEKDALTWLASKECRGYVYNRLGDQNSIAQHVYTIVNHSNLQRHEFYTPFFETVGYPETVPKFLIPFRYPGLNIGFNLALWQDARYAYWQASEYNYQTFRGEMDRIKFHPGGAVCINGSTTQAFQSSTRSTRSRSHKHTNYASSRLLSKQLSPCFLSLAIILLNTFC